MNVKIRWLSEDDKGIGLVKNETYDAIIEQENEHTYITIRLNSPNGWTQYKFADTVKMLYKIEEYYPANTVKKGDWLSCATANYEYGSLMFGKVYQVTNVRNYDNGIEYYTVINDNGATVEISKVLITVGDFIIQNIDAVKHDSGKPDFTLIPQEALLEVAKVFTHGADKYGVFNYSKGMEYRRYIAAAQRHINQWLRGEDIDVSNTNHLANAIASLMMVLDNQKTNKGTDNRNKVYEGIQKPSGQG